MTDVLLSNLISSAINGATGYTGSAGAIGYTGSRGTDGIIGSDGSQGDIGYTGSQGAAGEIPATFVNDITFSKAIIENVYTVSGTTPTIDTSNGTIQLHTITAATTYTSELNSGEYITFMIVNPSSFVITWPTEIKWVGGTAPTIATSGYSIIELWKVTSNLYGAYVGNVA